MPKLNHRYAHRQGDRLGVRCLLTSALSLRYPDRATFPDWGRVIGGVFAICTSTLTTGTAAIALPPPGSPAATLPDPITTNAQGQIRVRPLPMDAADKNPWTDALEVEFWRRANQAIRALARPADQPKPHYGNLFFENEKRSYPLAMMDFLAGNRQRAIAFLQQPDPDSLHTLGIDLYPSFTLKGQIRKYFFFGQFLDPDYRQRMYDAAKLWSATDPLTRQFPQNRQFYTGSRDRCSSWVDCRNTDNLRAMRETSVYLLAEATGNETTRQIYKQYLRRYVRALYTIGMGEWDSSVYHGHTITAYANLYDFARDREVRLLAKAALDWLYTAGALKYWRGGFGGPSKRDYSQGNQVWAAGATEELGLFFGDAPIPNPSPHADLVYLITSNYRPPLAVVALARKQFAKPMEWLNSKPTYENWKPGADAAPQFYETLYIGHTFQVGTLAQGSGGDWNGFKLMATNHQRGVDYLVASTGTDPTKISTSSIGGEAIAQYRNLILWLNSSGTAPFQFFLPKAVGITQRQGIIFLQYEQTWIALHPIQLRLNLAKDGANAVATAKIAKTYPDDHILTAEGTGGTLSGLALEIGEPQTHGSFAQFQTAVLRSSRLDLSKLAESQVEYRGSRGDRLKLHHQGTALPIVWRNGQRHDWRRHYAIYQPAPGGKSPLSLGWKQGELRVEAGGYRFVGRLSADGRYTVLANP